MADRNLVSEVRKTIDRLIARGTRYDVDALDQIYHRDPRVFMIGSDGHVSRLTKKQNMPLFPAKRNENAPPLDTSLGLKPLTTQFMLAIRLRYEEQRWQLLDETVFVSAIGPDVL